MKKNNRKIYVVGPQKGYANWMQGQIINDMAKADLVVFTGGEDISPDIYKQPAHNTTCSNPHRDRYELREYERARELNKHLIGICRGHQLLTALAGGILVQHQKNPSLWHPITTEDGEELLITSLHHQAAYPWRMNKEDYNILGWSSDIQSNFHLGGDGEELVPQDGKEVEMIHLPKIRALGVQGHPEMMLGENHPEVTKTINYLRNKLDLFLDDKL